MPEARSGPAAPMLVPLPHRAILAPGSCAEGRLPRPPTAAAGGATRA
jgi:hypothetical protein